jgi:hypothetical protein
VQLSLAFVNFSLLQSLCVILTVPSPYSNNNSVMTEGHLKIRMNHNNIIAEHQEIRDKSKGARINYILPRSPFLERI